MKRLAILLSLCALISSLQVEAQNKTSYSLGGTFGGNLTRFVEQKVSNSFLFSYTAGLALEQRFNDRIAVAYGLMYSKQGNLVHLSNPGMFDRVRTKYNYLTLPVALRYKLKNYPIVLSPGVQIGYLLHNETVFLPVSGYTNNDNPLLKTVDLGYSLGVGYRFSERFFGELKYYQSLTTVFKEAKGFDPITNTYTRLGAAKRDNQVISFSIYYYPFLLK